MKILKSLSKRGLALFLVLTMCLSLLPTTALAEGTVDQVVTEVSSVDENVKVTKRAERVDGSDKATITMEAYVNGKATSTTTTTHTPLDIVLVLDQSGSMKGTNLESLKTALNGENGFIQSIFNDAKTNNVDHRIAIVGYASDKDAGVSGSSANGYTISPGSSQSHWINTGLFVNGTLKNYQTKTEASYEAVYSSDMDQAQTYYIRSNGQYRAISYSYRNSSWGYGGGGYGNWKTITPKTSSTDRNNTQVYRLIPETTTDLSEQDYQNALVSVKTGEGVTSSIATAIGNLAASGGTYTEYGLKMAEQVFANNDGTNRQRVVVLFTDGASDSSANNVLTEANTLKSSYNAKVYTIVLGAASVNDLFQHVSSNYITASYWDWDYSGTRALDKDGNPETKYAKTADNSSQLTDIFVNFSQDIVTTAPAIEVTEEAVLKDQLSPQFVFDDSVVLGTDGVVTKGVNVYSVAAIGTGDKPTWDMANKVDITNDVAIKVTGNAEERTIQVEGFDYSADENFVIQDSKTKEWQGHKLVFVFTVKPDTGYTNWGETGIPVSTNVPGASLEQGEDVKVSVKDPDNPEQEGAPSITVDTYTVTYDWGTAPSGNLYDANGNEVTLTIPTDARHYISGQDYGAAAAAAESSYPAGQTYYTHDTNGNVKTAYTFSGWQKGTSTVMGDQDVAITGSWTPEDAPSKPTLEELDNTAGLNTKVVVDCVNTLAGHPDETYHWADNAANTVSPVGVDAQGNYVVTVTLKADGYISKYANDHDTHTAADAATYPNADVAVALKWNKTANAWERVTAIADGAADATFHANCTFTGYTVTFKPGDHAAAGSQDVVHSELAKDAEYPSIPEYTPAQGYAFDGWVDENNQKVTSFPATVTADAVYTAQWKQLTNWNGLSITKTLAGVERGGNTVAVTSNMKLRAGDVLTYTITINNGTGKVLTDVKISEMPNENITLGTVKDQNGAVLTLSADNEITIDSLQTGTTTLTVTATVNAEDALTGSAPHAANNVKIVDASSDDGDLPKPDPDDPDPKPDPRPTDGDDKEIETKVDYTVIWVEKGNESVVLNTGTRKGYVDDQVTVTDADRAQTFTGYNYDSDDTAATLAATGTVLKVYYTKNTHSITYMITYPDDFPEGNKFALDSYNESSVDYGTQKTVQNVPTTPALPAGYHFATADWTTTSNITVGANRQFNMPDENVTFTLVVEDNGTANYTIEYYQQTGVENGAIQYGKVANDTYTGSGLIGTTVSAPDGYQNKYTGYTYEVTSETLTSGTITNGNGLVLKLYYKWTPVPVSYTVTVNSASGTPSTAVSDLLAAKPEGFNSHIGATVTAETKKDNVEFFVEGKAIEDTVNGKLGVWKFSGWDLPQKQIEAADLNGVTFSGSWSFEAYETYGVTYQWGSASEYKPDMLPVDNTTYYHQSTGAQPSSYTVNTSLDTYKAPDSLVVYGADGTTVVGEYQFSGWKLSDDVTAENVTSGNINGNVNLYGFWTPVEYGVTYTITEDTKLPNDCEQGEQALDLKTYAIGDDVTVANTYNDVLDVDNAGATVGKWVFSGWELNGTVVTGTAKMVRGGLAFTGSWNYVEAYKATYEYTGTLPTGLTVNSATHGVNDPAYYFNGTTVTPAQPMATSYTDTDGSVWTFKGWNQTSAIMTNGQARFTGTWEKTSNATTSYTVKYYFETLDGGYVQLNEYPDTVYPSNATETVRVGDKVNANAHEATLSGEAASMYELSRTEPSNGITLVANADDNVLEYYYDLKEFTVTYEFGPDSAASNPYVYDQLPESVTVKYGETITVPSADEFTKAPVYEGMYLTGWWEFTSWNSNSSVTIMADTTITGTWTYSEPTPNAKDDIEVQKDYLGDYRWRITVANVGMCDYFNLALKDQLSVVYDTNDVAAIDSGLMRFDSAEIIGYETSEPEWTTVTVIWQDQDGNTRSEKEIVELEIYETLDGVIVVPDEYYTAFDGLEPGEWGEPVRQADGSIVITWVLEPVVDPDAAADADISDPDNVDTDDSTDNANDVDVNDDIDTIDDVDDNDDVDNNDGADDADTVDNDDVTNDVEDDGLASEEDELSKALIAYAAAQMGIDLDNFDLLVGQTLVVEVSISERDLLTQVTQGGTHTLRNTALVYEENDPDPIGSDENDEAEITIAENPGIEVNKTASASSVKPGDTVTYTITVKNTGNVVLSNVVVDDPMMPNGGEWIDTLAIDAEKQYTYSVVATESGTLVNTVTVTSGGAEDTETVTVTVNPVAVTYNVTYNLAGGSSSATLSYTRNAGDPTPTIPNPTREGYTFAGWSPAIAATVTRDVTYTAQWTPAAPASDEPSMSVRKTANRTTASVGDVITYTITVTNTGRVALTNIVVSDPMMANGSVTIATLAVGESRTITYTHTVTAAEVNTTLRNRVTVSGTNPNNPGQDDPDPKTDEVDTPIVPSVPVGPIGPIGGGGGGGTTTPSNPTPPASDSGETIDDEDVPLAAPGLNSTDHFDYVKGYEDGTVRPAANITRGEVATIFFRLMTNEFRSTNWSTESGFPDVISGTWYNNAVSTCVKAGLLHGYLDGTFQADQPITRAEFATIAAGFASEAVPAGGMFTDIEGHWAKEHIERAAAAGWIKGDAGEFRPDDLITRAEVITSINRMLDRIPSAERMLEGMKTFVDNTPDMWWYADVQEATNSHDYERGTLGMNSVDFTETWTELLPEQDWTALEKEWATAADANVVDVMVPASSEDEAGEPEAE